jgi:hypothetical protein
MRVPRLCALGVIVATLGCSGTPTDPRTCADNPPRYPNWLSLNCSPSGSTINCTARAQSTGLYCVGPSPGDVTNSVRWVSTNTAVGRLVRPGVFEITAPGATVIYADTVYAYSYNAYAYAFGGGGTIRSLVPVDVQVADVGATDYTLSFASVEFTPDGSDTQTCRLGNGLPPFTPCRFWVDPIDSTVSRFALPPATVVASKPGYVTERRVERLRGVACETCSPHLITFILRRTR